MGMNRQIAPGGIEWTRVWGRPGYTWNAAGGCTHECEWDMPDGSTAICYAKELALRLQDGKFYPHGFEHHYWNPERLEEPLKKLEPSGIFLDSMSDLMDVQVPDDHVRQVLDVAARADWHVFQLLTKNAPRLLKFEFPPNVWVGVSSPPTRYKGLEMTEDRRKRYMFKALDTLAKVKAPVRWLSIEPLSFDMAAVLGEWSTYDWVRNIESSGDLPIEWAVIGAASNGRKLYQPKAEWVTGLLDLLDTHDKPVFFKGNLDWPRTEWRAAFPPEVKP
jgi:protein gp37